MMPFWLLRYALPLVLWAGTGQAAAQNAVYTTWEGKEVDKCASIWLIRHFIAPGASIRFVPTGTPVRDGVPFDTPDALLRRYAHRSTFEVLLQHHGLEDSGLQRMGRIIHDIEINIWGRKATARSPAVEQAVREMTEGVEYPEFVRLCDGYFGDLYRRLASEHQADGGPP